MLPGGFVGVDIFFVISGYLITRVIRQDMARGTFGIADFYDRRVRRIFPALFTVFAVCLVASAVLDFPSEARETSRTLLAAIAFVSNIFFYAGTDAYFSSSAELNLLLHTWSLSVEEQFYVAFPLLMLATRRWTEPARNGLLAAIAVASLAHAGWTVRADASAAFYLMPSRAWELLVGALLAGGILPACRPGWPAEATGAVGLALVAGSVAFLNRTMPFPGPAALAPCLGAAALIHAGGSGGTLVGRLLSLPPMRFLGLISYSLYLWHWPVLVAYKRLDDPVGLEKVGLLVASIALAFLSWRFVERPFRGRGAGNPRPALLAGGAVMAATGVLALMLGALSGVVRPAPASAEQALAYLRYDLMPAIRGDRCFLTTHTDGIDFFQADECLRRAPGRANVLVLGDSHAAHLWPGLTTMFPAVNFLEATASLCKPTLPVSGDRRCVELVTHVVERFLPDNRLDAILIAARWQPDDLPGLQRIVAALQRFAGRIIVLGPIVEYEQPLPRILARGIRERDVDLPSRYRRSGPDDADTILERTLTGPSVKYVSVRRLMCAPQCAVWSKSGAPLQFDYGHLTREGSIHVASLLDPRLFRMRPAEAAPDARPTPWPEGAPPSGRADAVSSRRP